MTTTTTTISSALRLPRFLTLLTLAAVAANLAGCPVDPTNGGDPTATRTITIGVLNDQSPGAPGRAVNEAIRIAVDDVNNWLVQLGSDWRLATITGDTEGNPDTALDKFEALADRGVQLVIGPGSDDAVAAVLDTARNAGMLLISPTSIAADLALDFDPAYRLLPSRVNEAATVAAYADDLGYEVLLFIGPDDLSATEFDADLAASFESFGGVVQPGFFYDPATADFVPLVESVSAEAAALLGTVEPDQLAIVLDAGDELPALLTAAATDETLASLAWFGTSFITLDQAVLADEAAAAFATQTTLTAPRLDFVETTPEADTLNARLAARVGFEPDLDALAAYDAVWLAAWTYLAVDTTAPSTDDLATALESTAAQLFGLSGWLVFDDAGDRAAYAYDFYTVTESNDTYSWAFDARYAFEPLSQTE